MTSVGVQQRLSDGNATAFVFHQVCIVHGAYSASTTPARWPAYVRCTMNVLSTAKLSLEFKMAVIC